MPVLPIFQLQRPLGRWRYLFAVIALTLVQHGAAATLTALSGKPLNMGFWFWLVPARALVNANVPPVILLLDFVFSIGTAALLVALSLRRAVTIGRLGASTALSFVPVLQWGVFLYLAFVPALPAAATTSGEDDEPGWIAATQGVIAGLALTLASVALGALVFGSYGYTMFVLTPVFVGATTGYIVNRKRDLGVGKTNVLVLWAIALGGLALLVAALEGVICIIMAAPLAIGVGMIGGLIGRALALYGRSSPGRAAASLAVLPLLFGAEHALPPSIAFDSAQSVTVNASADAVWRAVVDMQPIRAAPPLPLRLGVAYPISARLEGEGIGGRRIGVFSTGEAVEQITEWQPGRRLAFKILSDPPAMRELSPYRHVHAPHVHGYFLTHTTAFDITALPDGRSRLTVSSTHELRLDPVFYWLPLARVVVRADDRRVLDHLRQQAEGG